MAKNYFSFICPKCKKRILVVINSNRDNPVFNCPNCDEIYTLKELSKEENNGE